MVVAEEVRVPLGRVKGIEGDVETAVSIFRPDRRAHSLAPVAFAFPGAGYSRRYFDMQIPGLAGYSMAEHWVAAGGIFVACDHVGAGDSTLPEGELTAAALAAAAAATVERVLPRLAFDGPAIGIGHSMGGHVVTLAQADHRPFTAIAILGWSADQTAIRREDGSVMPDAEAIEGWAPPTAAALPERYADVPAGYLYLRPRPPRVRRAFYPDDVSDAVLEADEEAMSVIAPGIAGFSAAGFGRAAARRVDVPTFLAFGERDVAADPHLEPSFYPRVKDLTLYVLPASAHCHTFAPSRRELWERLRAWAAATGPLT